MASNERATFYDSDPRDMTERFSSGNTYGVASYSERHSTMPPHNFPPPGTNHIAIIQPTLNGILIAHSFTVTLLPLVIALFYFSSPHSRRTPIFTLNLITIILAFTVGVISDYRGVRTIISPTDPPPLAYDLVIGVLGSIQYILIDTILLVRLIAVYPMTYVGASRFFLIIALPVLLKIGRVINLFMFIKLLAVAARDPVNASAKMSMIWLGAPNLKIEWSMQLSDNVYASAFFLWRLVLHNRDCASSIETAQTMSTVSIADRLKSLFWIAVTNFVVPILFSLAQIVIVYREVDYVVINDVVLVNTSIAVIGVVFASIWAGSYGRGRKTTSVDCRNSKNGGNEAVSTIVFESMAMSDSEGTDSRDGNVEYTQKSTTSE